MSATAISRVLTGWSAGRARARVAWPGFLALAAVALLASDQGGYFATTWGWATLAFLWIGGLALVLRRSLRVGRARVAFVLGWAAVVGWTALSILWSTDVPQTVLEVERSLAYLAAVAMLVLVAGAASRRHLLGGLLCAIAGVSLFSLGTKLFPNELGVYDTTGITQTTTTHSGFANTGLPTISGVARVGQTLTVSDGSWTPTPSGFRYAWHLCRSGSCPLSPTTASQDSYVVQPGDVGYKIVVQVAPDGDWSQSVDSPPSAQISAAPVDTTTTTTTTTGTTSTGTAATIGVNRLAQPIGYWNGLSAFTAIGMVLALGFAARSRALATRALSAALLVPLLATFYFTFGRTGWIALAAGLAATMAFDRRRLQLLTLLAGLFPVLALDVWLSSRSHGLTEAHTLAQASRDGRHLAVELLVLAAAAAAVSLALGLVESRVLVPRAGKVAFVVALSVGVGAGAGLLSARYGGPVANVKHAWRGFKAPPPQGENLDRRLLQLSGNGRYDMWRIAWDDARSHPWLGSGAGSYERYFLRHQPADVLRVRDAHGLYIEMLAELGPLGLALLLVALGLPFVVMARRRRGPLTALAAGAYVVFLVHAVSDWDWELPAITLAGLVCATVLVLGDRGVADPDAVDSDVADPVERVGVERTLPSVLVRVAAGAGLAAAGVFALVGLIGNSALSSSRSDLSAGKLASAESQARRAASWAPWSADPWDSLGRAQLATGDLAAAEASFRKALSIDRNDWQLWYDLAQATSGDARRRAVEESLALYPRSGLRLTG